MPTRSRQVFRVEEQDLSSELAFETTNSPTGGEAESVAPVATLASLDMSDELRAMFETAQPPDVLPRLYKDLRERLAQVSDKVSDSRALDDRVQTLSRQVKTDVQDLREMVEAHAKEMDHDAHAAQSELQLLRGRIETIADSILDPQAVNDKILVLISRLKDMEAQVTRACDQIHELRELTSSLTTENTLLRSRVRNLDESRSISHASRHSTPTPTSREQATRAVPVASQSPVIDTASQAVPRREPQALPAPPRVQDRANPSLEPPTFEEFMSGVRAPTLAPRPQVNTTSVTAPAPLNTLANTPVLVTTCDAPIPVAPRVQVAVVSYRHYRLRDTRATLSVREGDVLYRVKSRFDSLYPTFATLDGTVPIKLLEFFSTLREEFDTLQVSEAVTALALAHYFEGCAKTHYTAQTSPGVRNANAAMSSTWPYLVDSMLKRYLTDQVLQKAYDKVTDATQEADKDENKFADRLISAARDCCNVFEDRDLVNYYIRGLLPSTRDAVTERVRQLPVHEQGEITDARRVAQAEGNTYRARRAAQVPSSARSRTPTRGKAMLVANQTGDLTPTPSPPRRPDQPHLFGAPQAHWVHEMRREDPELTLRIAKNLESLLFVGDTTKSPRELPTSPTSTTSLEELVSRTQVELPQLTEAQCRDAITVIPTDYWTLNCWTCRTDGHTTFTCPSLTPAQRMYFAYCYFLYRCKGHPAMRGWLHGRHAKHLARAQDSRQDSRRDTHKDGDSRAPPLLKSPGSGKFHGKPYQNHKDRENARAVRFAKTGGVFITTHIGDAPPNPSWQEKSDSSESENEKGQE